MKKKTTAYCKPLIVAVLASMLALSGCGTALLPPMDFKVVDTKATPDELLQPSVDPISTGTIKPFQPAPFVPVEITAPKADKLFGLTNTVDKGPWAKTQNTTQILVNGRRLVDASGTIRTWSPISNTGFVTYLVKNDRVEQTPDGLSHYDLKMLDVRAPGRQAEVLATLATDGSRHLWRFGKDAQPQLAELYHLTSKGVVLMREDNSVITYFEAGKAPVTTALPVGYKATAFGVTTDLVVRAENNVIHGNMSVLSIYYAQTKTFSNFQ